FGMEYSAEFAMSVFLHWTYVTVGLPPKLFWSAISTQERPACSTFMDCFPGSSALSPAHGPYTALSVVIQNSSCGSRSAPSGCRFPGHVPSQKVAVLSNRE